MTTNNMTYSTQEIRAFITLYRELGLDITSLPTDLEHDYLTVNDGTDGNTYAWFFSASDEGAINIETGQVVTDAEQLEQLFYTD